MRTLISLSRGDIADGEPRQTPAWLVDAGLAAFAVLALAVCGCIAQQAGPAVAAESPVGLTVGQQERLSQVASASLFGQFRSNMADFLYLKADKYLHSGVDMRGLTPQERAGKVGVDRAGNAGGKDSEGQREHQAETTVVPAVRRDWRGALGDIEREVKPYKDMTHHTHRDPKETLPLFRLMTWSNPHFIPGYTVGAAMIARDHSKYADAIAYLQEGERNNPQCIEIQTELGEMITARLHQWDRAYPYLVRSITLGKKRDPTSLTEDEQESLEDAYRWAVLNRREAGDQKAAHAHAEEGLRLFPKDIVCRHYLSGHSSTLPEPQMHVVE